MLKERVMGCVWCAMGALGLASANAVAVEAPVKLTYAECNVVCIQDSPARHPASLFSTPTGEKPSGAPAFYQSSINVFLVEKGGRRCLIDAGNDPKRGSLEAQLRRLAIQPAEISDIFITHIHPDHVGGLLWEGKALFPKATLHIARLEYETWQADASRAALKRYIEPYQARLDLFDYEKTLPSGLLPVKMSGHTPGHTVFRLKLSENEEAVFAGDFLHSVELQVPHPEFCARYDANPAEAVAVRKKLLQEKAILFGAHIPFPGYRMP